MGERRHGPGARPPGKPRSEAGPGWTSVVLVACALSPLVLQLVGTDAATAVDAAAVGAGVAGIAAAYVVVREGVPIERPVRTVALLGVAFVVWSLVCAAFSGRGWSAFVGEPTNMLGALTLAALAAVGLAAAALGERLVQALGRAAVAVVALQVLFAAPQFVASGTARGLLPNSTYLGELVVLLLPLLLVERDGVWNAAGRVLAPAAAAVLAAAGSRVAAAAAVVWLVVVWAPAVARKPQAAWLVRIGVVAVAVVGAAVFSRDEIASSITAAALGERPQMWQASAWAVAARPLLGYGPDGFVPGAASVLDLERLQRGAHLALGPGSADPHSALAWVAVSCGLVGAVLFAVLAAAVARAWRIPGRPPVAVAGAWGAAMAFAVFLTAPAALQVLPAFALVLGASLVPGGAPARSLQQPPSRPAWLRPVAYATALASLALALNAGTRLPFEVASADRSPSLAPAALAAARAWRVDAHLWYLASLHSGWAVCAQAPGIEPMADLAAARRAASLDRRDPWYAFEAARTLAFYGVSEAEVEAAFAEAFRRWPAFPIARAERASWLARRGRTEEAKREISLVRPVVASDPQLAEAVRAAEAALAR
ncbi:MAG: O-antigen ligase family protein [Anaerosomatales bacterium]|nr:O-antigen ligase family protein [Anaerosomatales bacterium]